MQDDSCVHTIDRSYFCQWGNSGQPVNSTLYM